MMRKNNKAKFLSLVLAVMLTATMPGISVCAEEVSEQDAEILMSDTGDLPEGGELIIEEAASDVEIETVEDAPEESGDVGASSIIEDTDVEILEEMENPEEVIEEVEEETENKQDVDAGTAKTIAQAGSLLRTAMVARKTEIELTIAKDADFGLEDTDAILEEAYKHTGVEDEGDYLKHNVSFTTISFTTDEEKGTTTLKFEFCYNTTLTQENAVAAEIQKLDSKYKIADMTSDYNKVLAIYELIGDMVNYDYARKDNAVVIGSKEDFVQANYIQQTAYAALINHYAVCEGYALLFYRLALHYGLDNRIVTGFSGGEDHGWNVVKVSGKYYFADTTWDSGRGRNEFQYFLKSADDMFDHELDEESLALTAALPLSETSQLIKTSTIKSYGIYKYVLSYGAIIIGIDNPSECAITIPATLGGKPVVSLDCSIEGGNSIDSFNTTGITFPDGIYRIKGYGWIFGAAKSVTFPATLNVDSESMNRLNLDSLTTIKVNAGSKTLKIVNNALYTYDGSALVKYPVKSTASTYKVAAGTREIYSLAFRYASNLTEVTLPDSVEEIGNFSFEGCSNLSKINLPANLRSLGEWVFSDTKLSGKITFPAGIEWIGSSDYIGTSVTAFEIPEGNAFGYFSLNGILCLDFNHEGIKQIVEAPPKMANPVFSVPDDFLYVVSNSFKDSNLKEISLNEGLVSLGNCSLENCPNLTKVIVPSSVSSIDERAFGYNNNTLKSVYILSKDVTISEEAFSGTTTTVYGYKGSTIEQYCQKNKNSDGFNVTFKEITGPVYNWGVNGERCSMTMLDASGTPVSYQADKIDVATADGVTTYTATFKVDGQTYTNKKIEKSDYKLSISAAKTTISASTSVTASGMKEDAKVTFKSSDSSIATVDATGKVTPVSVGYVTIIATAAETAHYKKQAAEITLKVVPKTTTFSSVQETADGVVLSWTKNTTAGGYYIYRDSKLIKTIRSQSTVTCTDTAVLTNGTLYTYKIVAFREAGDGSIMKASTGSIKFCYLTRPSLTLANTSTGCKVSWKANSQATGYYVYRSISGGTYKKVKTITSPSTISFTDTGANVNGTKYSYKVYAYKTVSDTSYKSRVSAVKSYYFVTRPSISSLTCSAKNTMLVKWAKKTGVTGYQIQYSLSSTFASGNKTVTVSGASSVSKSIASLTKGKTYYVRLRCYKTVSSSKYYSAWSTKKSVLISK